MRVRAILEHRYGSALSVTVFIEGDDGCSLDAASVTLSDPSGDLLLLRYDGQTAAYGGEIASPQNGNYTVCVISAACSGETTLVLPFAALSVAPAVSSIQDETGVAYELGGQPSRVKAINVAWASVPGATVYSISCARQGSVLFSETSTGSSITIPAGTLESGTCSFSVEAQYIAGDPLLRAELFYSVSAARAPSVLCTIAP